MHILVINSGSSSLKYKLFDMGTEAVLTSGAVADIGGDSAAPAGGRPVRNHEEALAIALGELAGTIGGGAIDAIGHRVVHGGPDLFAPTIVDRRVRSAIAAHSDLAPLHNPANLMGIEAAGRLRPKVPQVAVFDSGFHHTMPAVAATYALPRDLARSHGLRRYGFHGTSCAWSLGAASSYLARPAESLNLIVAHLGAGASVTAIRAGRSVDTSMGLSPLGGLMMQTRAGDLDPGIVLKVLREGMSLAALDQVLNHESGVKALAGEADMMTVAERSWRGDADAAFAREAYAYRVAHYVGAYAGLAWPLDALVFTGGIGENDAELRSAVIDLLPQLGFKVDGVANNNGSAAPVRSVRAMAAGPELLVVRADEELQIARETVSVLRTAK